MAHAGTPTDLAKQPATSTVNGLGQALLLAVMLVAFVAAIVFVATNIAAKGSTVPATGRSDAQVEAQRDATLSAAAKAVSGRTDDEIEQIRGAALNPTVHYPDVTYDQVKLSSPTKISGTAPDNRPGRIKGHRGAMIDQ
ncbi:MAG: hypothetical protein ACJ77V_03890 [Chloroflexota bacterium]|jgi:hypothetical protein